MGKFIQSLFKPIIKAQDILLILVSVLLFNVYGVNAQSSDSINVDIYKFKTDIGKKYEGYIVNEDDKVYLIRLRDGNPVTIVKEELKRKEYLGNFRVPHLEPEKDYKPKVEMLEDFMFYLKTYKYENYYGRILEIDQDTSRFSFKDIQGDTLDIRKEQLYKFKKLKNSYPMVGITYGLAKTWNILFGYNLDFIRLHYSLGPAYLWNKQGICLKLNIGVNINRIRDFSHSLFVSYFISDIRSKNRYGTYYTENYNWEGFKLSYNIHVLGLFFDIGISAIKGGFKDFFVDIQLGYVYEFKWDNMRDLFLKQ